MTISKSDIFKEVRQFLLDHNISIRSEDRTRPWGGFFVLDESDIDKFLQLFFSTIDPAQLPGLKLSPKILLVAPYSRLSWQYHNRRAEIWTIVGGPVEVAISDTDEEGKTIRVGVGNSLSLRQGQRHRLIGLDSWGIVAEIWQHTDATAPSDEDDIIRVQDDYNR